jgi:vacuolar-type H+-ATPase subunit E/Vma4
VGEIAPAALGRGEISSQLIREAREVAAALLKKASPELARAVREALRHALHFRGRSVREGLREADKATAARKSAARKI